MNAASQLPATLPDLLAWRVGADGDLPAVTAFEDGEWRRFTWREYAARVRSVAAHLRRMGVERGDRVAICGRTSFDWAVADLATLSIGGTVVALHPQFPPAVVAECLAQAPAKVVFLGEGCAGEPFLASGIPPERVVTSLASLFDLPGEDLPRLGPKEIATISFTSGTSSRPKAVVLTHENLVCTAWASYEGLGRRDAGARSFHWLPFAHLFGRLGLYLDLVAGCHATYLRELKTMPEDFAVGKPHFLFVVPLALTRFRDRVLSRVGPVGSWRRRKFLDLVDLAYRRPGVRRLLAATAFRPVSRGFGANLRLLIVGGAPVDPELCQFFEALGIFVREGYGMTETSGVAYVNSFDGCRVGTAGTRIATVEGRIGEEGELELRGPSIFQGYVLPEDNRGAFTDDGWFRTGDLAHLDDGYLRIVGRRKELMITAAGENVSPEPIERLLERHEDIEEAVVVGDGRPYLTALLRLREGAARAEAECAVKGANEQLASYCRIRAFDLFDTPLSVESGDLTATLKKRRQAIEARFREPIESLYLEQAAGGRR